MASLEIGRKVRKIKEIILRERERDRKSIDNHKTDNRTAEKHRKAERRKRNL
jgi:hypothetical protein